MSAVVHFGGFQWWLLISFILGLTAGYLLAKRQEKSLLERNSKLRLVLGGTAGLVGSFVAVCATLFMLDRGMGMLAPLLVLAWSGVSFFSSCVIIAVNSLLH